MKGLSANPYFRPRLHAFDYLGLVAGRRALEAILEEELGTRRGLRLLDIGCGSSPWRPLFDRYAIDYVGLDIKPGPTVTIVASAEKIPLPDESIDVVFSISALEHIPDDATAVSEMRRVLKRGGLAIVGVPFFWEVHGEPHDYRRWTPFGLRRVFAAFASCRVVQSGGPLLNFLLTQNVFLRHLQLKCLSLRWLISPFIAANNLAGRLFGMGDTKPTTFATFYIVVAHK